MTTLQQQVDTALDAAVFQNGYHDLMTHSPQEVAHDLCTYYADLELAAEDQVALCVLDYQQWYHSGGHHIDQERTTLVP